MSSARSTSAPAMSRRAFMAGSVLGATGTLAARRAKAQAATVRPPNVVYVFSDEHRWQSMAHTELPEVQSPFMSAFADGGFEFSQCISNYPVCSPYRAILMSGRWPYQQGVIDNNIPLSPEETTLGKVFQNAGYKTGYIGKWHLGGTRAEPFGFDTSLIWTGDANHREATYHPAGGEPVTQAGYTVDMKTDQAVEFMDRHRAEPFMLMVSYNAPHAWFTDAPDELNALYPSGSLPLRPNVDRSEANGKGGASRFIEKHYLGYHAHITGVDRALKRISDAIAEMGLAEDTIFVHTSDHGSMFGSHGVGSKRQPYEESIRVPFMIRWPGHIQEGVRNDALFGSIDLFPTICGIAGLPIPRTCQGLDFSPWFRGDEGPDPDSQFIMHIQKTNAFGKNEHPAPLFRGVRTRTHTYAILDDGPVWLFDNTADPYQMDNRADDDAMRDVRAECHGMLNAWLQAAHDPRNIGTLATG